MKRIKFFLLALVIGTVIVIGGCGDDNNPVDPGPGGLTASGSFTLNGGGYDNQNVNIVAGGAEYDPSTDQTGVVLYGVAGGDTATVVLLFPGNQAGTFPWDNDSSSVIFYTNISTLYTSLDGSTTVSTFGTVGNNVSGTFEGVISLATLTDSISIDGTFSAKRISDSE